MFSCAWPFQLQSVSWIWGGWGVEEHAREFASDTCYTGWGRRDIWRAIAERELKGKKVVTDLHVRESWQHREGCSEESLEDRHRDINWLWPPQPPTPTIHPAAPAPVRRASPIYNLWMDEGIRWTLLWKESTCRGCVGSLCLCRSWRLCVWFWREPRTSQWNMLR